AWQRDYGPRPAETPVTTSAEPGGVPVAAPTQLAGEVPALPSLDPQAASTPALEMAGTVHPALPMIKVRTDVLSLDIDPKGAQIIGARLLQYPIEKNEPDHPFVLLSNESWGFHIAQSGLRSAQPAPGLDALYQTSQPEWVLAQG